MDTNGSTKDVAVRRTLSLRRSQRALPLAVALGAALVLGGCSARSYWTRGNPTTAPASDVFWAPSATEKAPAPRETPPAVPPDLQGKRWTLTDVLDVALRNNPATRAAWADARAAAAGYDIQRAAYLPRVDLGASGGYTETYDSRYDGNGDQLAYGSRADLTWLLLDAGGRAASVEGARQTLLSANWTQNAVLQDTVLTVETAYFAFVASQAGLEARRASLRDAERQLDASNHRHDAGVATLADVLQSQTAAAQAKLAVQSGEGLVQIARGYLASSLGLPANYPFDLADFARDPALEMVDAGVDQLISEAMANLPALAAARSSALAARERVRKAESDGLPTLSLGAAAGMTRFEVGGSRSSSTLDHTEDFWSGALLLKFPLFTGYSQTATVEQARAQAAAADERVKALEQQVMFQVFSSYYGLKTASEKVKTARALLASATQSEVVARGRYDEGVGTILEVLTAQSALADARAQTVQSHFEWYTTLAQLARNTGLLGLRGETPLRPARINGAEGSAPPAQPAPAR